ncbi:MAG: threonine--tRNA ligase [Candidatus Omnitrophica bacterium]|nr:threonine--tRNA ligase [Candidatus Omnitrophota bacterium]
MDINILRHSASHIMADAVKQLFPDVKLGIGPAVENGFYYDFERKTPFVPEDLKEIEKKMHEIVKADLPFKKEQMPKEKALELFNKMGEQYKAELIKDIPDKEVSIYTQGKFTDLCRGPHVSSTGEVKVFKLLSIAGAYWRGIDTNPMLQRIYGTAFETKKELDDYLKLLEEAQKRDHRKIGKELEYFSMHDEIGAGLILYHPKGGLLRTIIEDWEKREHLKRGYQIVIGPHISKSDIWVHSGHYENYRDLMYIFEIEGQEYTVKPMNCPGHILIYQSKTRSYKDLPLRFFELGSVYRYEKSGVLHGLLRVRGFTQDDAHIFCLEEQVVDEITAVIDFVSYAMKTFGFNEFMVEISTRPPKSIGSDQMWKRAQDALTAALDKKGLKYQICEGEGAFYGPKIDIKLKDAIGRFWQCATIQCDFALPERFNLTYVGQDGKEYRPVMLHRVILGSMERFIGALLEHYAGALPLWLNPVQVAVIPITDKEKAYAEEVKKRLSENDIRIELYGQNETLNYKIRQAQSEKIPYMLIVGAKEASDKTVSVRARSGKTEGQIKLDDFIDRALKEIQRHG